jgi:hypothetical protein
VALLGYARVVERTQRVYEVREEVGEVLLQPLPAVAREYVRYCADVSAMAGELLAETQPLRPLR